MTPHDPHFDIDTVKPRLFSRVLDFFVPSRREKDKLSRQYDRLEAFSRAIPLEYCGWDQSGVQAMSPGFCNLLGVKSVTTFEDIQGALAPDDAAVLAGLYDRLREYGENFEISLHTLTGNRALKAFGKRGEVQQGARVFPVLWVMDISNFAAAAQRSIEVLSSVEKKETDLRASLNALPFPVWIRNQNLDITWCNKAYARAVDDTNASVVAEQKELPMTGVSRKDLSQRVLAQRAMAKQAPEAMRGHIISEGQRKLVEMVEIPLIQEKRVVGLAMDVTKEEELAASYERLAASHRESMEQLRTAIAMFDAETRLEFYNLAYEQMSGLSANFLDSRPKMVEIVDKLRERRKLPEQADYKQFKQQWLNRFQSLLSPYEEMQYLPDGTVVRMVVVPRPMGGLLVTQEDVTSHLRLETSYNTLIAVQQETMDNLSEGIAVFGEDGKLKLSNQAFAQMWNIAPDNLKNTPHITQLMEPIALFFDAKTWDAAKNDILGNALEREPRKGRLERNDGSVLEYSSLPLPDGNILNAYFDITDTVLVEHALLEKNAALQEAERLKTDFLANVSYQLRTPLNAIMGFTEMLNQQYVGKLNDRQLEYTSSMLEAGHRLVSLINDILDLSTIEAGYLKLYPAALNIYSLVDQVVQLTQEWARKQKLQMIVDCPADIMINGDERRLKQVLLNLISNAINYSPGGGTLTIRASRQGEWIDLSVSDTGMGIREEDLKRIFTPFDKINDGKAQRRGGAGLGLALVKSIIQLHGGDVRIDSRESFGTTVTCRLPADGAII